MAKPRRRRMRPICAEEKHLREDCTRLDIYTHQSTTLVLPARILPCPLHTHIFASHRKRKKSKRAHCNIKEHGKRQGTFDNDDFPDMAPCLVSSFPRLPCSRSPPLRMRQRAIKYGLFTDFLSNIFILGLILNFIIGPCHLESGHDLT